jgi:hypothetical protein
MADLIDRAAAHKMMVHLKRYVWTSPVSTERRVTVDSDDVNFGLDKLPTVDAVEVCRCKDCKRMVEKDGVYVCNHALPTKYLTQYIEMGTDILAIVQPDDFCSCGERRAADG